MNVVVHTDGKEATWLCSICRRVPILIIHLCTRSVDDDRREDGVEGLDTGVIADHRGEARVEHSMGVGSGCKDE